jgi:hypothetical protein
MVVPTIGTAVLQGRRLPVFGQTSLSNPLNEHLRGQSGVTSSVIGAAIWKAGPLFRGQKRNGASPRTMSALTLITDVMKYAHRMLWNFAD